GAWAGFAAGYIAGYPALVAAAMAGVGDEADVVVLAQASMAPAAEVVAVETPVLGSPRSAMAAVLESP
ncbi:MAG: arylsulfatase, partial [Ilumatobacter sp.]